jgi:endonuclease/exonuclease/phosphatase (EEP) superfamily protein YafD
MRNFFTSIGTLTLIGFAFVAVAVAMASLWWLFELTTHFTAYWALDTAVLAVFFFVLKCPRRGVMALLLAVFFASGLVRYVVPSDDPRAGGAATIEVTLFNLLHRNDRHADVLAFLRGQDSDVLVLQEYSPEWAAALKPLIDSYPHHAIEVRDSPFGNALLSKYPLEDIRWYPSKEVSNPYPSATLRVGDSSISLVALHPPPPVRRELASTRNSYLTAVGYMSPDVVVGDLNCTPWSPYFRRLLRETGLRDSGVGRGLKPTWYRKGLSIPIDHVLVGDKVKVLSRDVGPDLGSDHRPVTVELSF